MEYEMRERLAIQFADVIESVREEKWEIFCQAARRSGLSPRVAMARMLVRIVEDTIESVRSPSQHKK